MENLNVFFHQAAGAYRQPEPAGIERKVDLPDDPDPGTIWSWHFLFKLDEKWYEHCEGEWNAGGHNDGGASTWERGDLDDRKVDELIRQMNRRDSE